MADITPLRPADEVFDEIEAEDPAPLEEVLLDEHGNEVPTEEGFATPPPHNPTVGDDVASMAVLITQVAKDFRIKPDLAFKLLELTLNYKLAMRQLTSAPPSFIPPYPTSPETEETTDGDEA